MVNAEAQTELHIQLHPQAQHISSLKRLSSSLIQRKRILLVRFFIKNAYFRVASLKAHASHVYIYILIARAFFTHRLDPQFMLPILQVGDVLLSPDILTEHFCCDLEACGGACCIEGEAGAPITPAEVKELERVLPVVWMELDPKARKVLNKQGVAYRDEDGDLVTIFVNVKDCCFTLYE